MLERVIWKEEKYENKSYPIRFFFFFLERLALS